MRSNIYKPEIRLSNNEKKLLKIIAAMILGDAEKVSDNYDDHEAVLSDDEALELLDLLTLLMDSPDFKRKTFFVESLISSKFDFQGGSYQLFFDGMKRSGKTPAMARAKWQELVTRYRGKGNEPPLYKPVEYMSFEHFLSMERKLFQELGLDPFTLSYLLIKIRSTKTELENVRQGQAERSIRIDESLNRLQQVLSGGQRIISKVNLASVFVCVANTGLIFTTRDWTVAGGISAIGGALLNVKK